MKTFLKKNWFIITFVAAPLMAGLVFLVSLNSRIFNSPEQKVEHENAIKTMPTAADRAVEVANDKHAVEIRQMRYNDNKRNDSIDRVHERIKDSTFIDQVKRQTVQIELMKQKMEQ